MNKSETPYKKLNPEAKDRVLSQLIKTLPYLKVTLKRKLKQK